MPKSSNDQCEFCSSTDVLKRIVIRDDLMMIFPSNLPIVPGHVLICPVRHVEKFDDLDDKELKSLWSMLKRVKKSLKIAFEAKGFNYAWNEGKVSGQSVPHLHVHVLPRKEGDTGVTGYEPRKFLYRTSSRKKSTEAEIASVANLIKKFI